VCASGALNFNQAENAIYVLKKYRILSFHRANRLAAPAYMHNSWHESTATTLYESWSSGNP
jgi:hypothetical protein